MANSSGNKLDVQKRANRAAVGAARVGVLDLGSNTILLLVIDEQARTLLEVSEITRLGYRVFERGHLDSERAAAGLEVVRRLSREARALGAGRIVAVGTEALRRASDGAAYLHKLEQVCELDGTRLLSGEEEARYTIEASRQRAGDATPLVVIDVGGGSTEVAWSGAGRVGGRSLPLGAVRLTEAHIRDHPLSQAELGALRQAVRREFEAAGAWQPPSAAAVEFVAVAGTATTLSAMEQQLERYDPERVEGYTVALNTIQRWVERLAALSLEQRRALPGLEPGRADVIVAGLVILDEVLRALEAPEVRISGRGVRHGVALALLAGERSL